MTLPLQFTFQYVYIKTLKMRMIQRSVSYLHSNMFILKRQQNIYFPYYYRNLHSNMFILKHRIIYFSIVYVVLFTFQYVYIKTFFSLLFEADLQFLHSNMFILKPQVIVYLRAPTIFTFQYVYIKTRFLLRDQEVS